MQSDIPDQASYVMEVKVYDDCRLTQTGTVTLTVPNTVNYYNIKHRTKKYVGFMKKKNPDFDSPSFLLNVKTI